LTLAKGEKKGLRRPLKLTKTGVVTSLIKKKASAKKEANFAYIVKRGEGRLDAKGKEVIPGQISRR